MMNIFNLKKWYLDFTTSDGKVCYLYFIALKVFGLKIGNLAMNLHLGDGSNYKISRNLKFDLQDNSDKIFLLDSYLFHKDDISKVHIEHNTFQIDLNFQPLHNLWSPTKNGIVLETENNFLSWSVIQPNSKVKGTILIDDRRIHIDGHGYEDYVEMSFLPSKLPIKELIWGRVHCDDFKIVFDQIETRDSKKQQYLFFDKTMIANQNSDKSDLETMNRDTEQNFQIELDNIKNETTIKHKDFSIILKHQTILEESPIVTSERIKIKFLKKYLVKLFGNPEEKKIFSIAELYYKDVKYSGNAIHEKAVWHWR